MSNDNGPFDLLQLRPVRRLILWRGFPRVFQAIALVAFVGVIALAWNAHAPDGVNGKLFAKSNVVTLLVWGLWWPAMIWGAVLLGRVWCAVCPLEWVSHVTESVARRLRLPARPLPRWMASGACIVALYATLQMLVAGVHLHRVPAYTAWFMVALLLTTVVTALVFRNRAFCRGFCPVGLLLGTYGRGGMIAVRPARDAQAAGPDARTCPSLLNPSQLNTNRDCLVCAQCIKACPDGMQLLVRLPRDARDARESIASWPVTLFVMLVSGFVTSELVSEWAVAQRTFLAPAGWLATALGWANGAGWCEGLWTLLIVPLLLWSAIAGVLLLLGERGSLAWHWRRLALPMAVIVSAGHMSKGLAKFVTWAPFIPHAWESPNGAATALAIAQKTAPAPAAWLGAGLVALVGLFLVTTAFFYAAREHRLAHVGGRTPLRHLAPFTIVAAGFLYVIVGWSVH